MIFYIFFFLWLPFVFLFTFRHFFWKQRRAEKAPYAHTGTPYFPTTLVITIFLFSALFSRAERCSTISSPLANFLVPCKKANKKIRNDSRVMSLVGDKRLGRWRFWIERRITFKSSLEAPSFHHIRMIFWSALKEFIRSRSVKVESWKFYKFSRYS